MSKNTIIKGTLILTTAGIITRILGFLNRIFLGNTIGFKEIGIYQLTFPLYILAIAISSNGISMALSKHIAYDLSLGNMSNAKKSFRKCIIIGLIISVIIISTVHIFSIPISIYILKNIDCAPMLKILMLAVPFVVIKSCINAYFIALGKPYVQGTTLLVEQIIRLTCIFLLFNTGIPALKTAMLAIWACLFGEAISCVAAIIFYMTCNKNDLVNNTKIMSTKHNSLENDILYLTSNNTIMTLFTSFEAILLPAMFCKYYNDTSYALTLFGLITGIVLPFLFFPATITTSMSTMLLPSISSDKAKNNINHIKSTIIKCSMFSIMLGLFAGFFYFFAGEGLCILIFKNAIAGKILKRMCFLCPVMYLSGTLSSITNGLDKTLNNLMYNLISISIRIFFVLILVPCYGIDIYIISMIVSNLILIICYIITLKKSFIIA